MVKRKKKTSTEISDSACKAIRQKLPSGLKAKFGSIGFVKWTCAYSPVLIVDPMKMVLSQAIPEGIYNAWMHQVHLHSSIDDEDDDDHHDNDDIASDDDFRLDEDKEKEEETSIMMLPVLVYWYGTSYEFSIVRLSQIIPWEEGCQKGYNILPPFMSRRIQKLRRPVPAVYSLLEDALIKVEEDGLPHPQEGRSLAIYPPGNKKKSSVVLNEWHALAMEAPPQEHSWMEQKQLIEPALPHSEWFGQIAFLSNKCGPLDYYHPVLVMHPFRVPPNHRTEWFNKCSSGKLVMVYWMGSYTSGRIQQHVFTCHPLSDLVPYDEGVKKRYDKVPKQVLHDYGNTMLGAKRMAQVDFWVCGTMWELPRALEREPKDRWGGLEDFEEDHDDDFDYFWECLNSAKEAQEAKQERKNGSGPAASATSGRVQRAASTTRRKRNALVEDTDEEDDSSHDIDDDSNTKHDGDDNLGLFDDSSDDTSNDGPGNDDYDDDDFQEFLQQQRKRKISDGTSKSDKERPKPTHARRMEVSSRRGKIPSKDGKKGGRESRNNSGVNEKDYRNERMTNNQEDLDQAVRRSLSHVAAILKEGTNPRPVNPKSSSGTTDHNQDFLPRVTTTTSKGSSDFMRELTRKRQAAATEKVVNDVVEQWTQVRNGKK